MSPFWRAGKKERPSIRLLSEILERTTVSGLRPPYGDVKGVEEEEQLPYYTASCREQCGQTAIKVAMLAT